MTFKKDRRKITGEKFTITLPQNWREAHGLKPGKYVDTMYFHNSPMVVIPKGYKLSSLETHLIKVLTGINFDLKDLIASLTVLKEHFAEIEKAA